MTNVSKRQIRSWFSEANSHVVTAPTKLFSIAPRGINTSQVQSLGSYCEHLALAHCATLKRQFMALSRNLFYNVQVMRPKLLEKKSSSKSVLEELEILTGRDDIKQCSLSWLMEFLSLRRWTSPNNRFCRQCLDEDLANCDLPYERLAWKISSIKLCTVHEVPLHIQGTCSKPKRLRRMHVQFFGVCANCDSVGYKCQLGFALKVSAAEAELSKQWVEVIQAAQTSDFTLARVKEGISQVAAKYASVPQFARACNLAFWHIRNIRHQKYLSVTYLENIALGSGATLLQILSATVPPIIPQHLPRYLPRRATLRSGSFRILVAAVSSPNGTIEQAIAESRRTRSFLRKLDCKLVERLEARETKSESENRFEYFRKLCQEVEKQVILAVQNGRPMAPHQLQLQSGNCYKACSYRGTILRLILRKLTGRSLGIYKPHDLATFIDKNFIDNSVAKIREQVTFEQLAEAELAYPNSPRIISRGG